MQLARPAFAMDPRQFGRGRSRRLRSAHDGTRVAHDLKLFATTFLGGFVFVSLLIA